MPRGTDIRIRLRLLWERCRLPTAFSVGLVVPVMAAWVLMLTAPVTEFNATQFVAEVAAAQIAEEARAEAGIYHVVREIEEGADKPAYVANKLGVTDSAPKRVDVVETFQHNETALARITSNETGRPLEVFLSRVHEDGGLSLHHYGPKTNEVAPVRSSYDAAHDVASLYDTYTSLERPSLPLVPEEANFVRLADANNQAIFSTELSESIRIDSYVDRDTKLVVEEVIYVTDDEGKTYEMTRVRYRERSLVPADRFADVFDPTQYDYEVVAQAEAS